MIPWWGCLIISVFSMLIGYVAGSALGRQQILMEILTKQAGQGQMNPMAMLKGGMFGDTATTEGQAPRA